MTFKVHFHDVTAPLHCTGNCIDFSLAAWLYAVRTFAVASVLLTVPVLLLLIVPSVNAPERGLRKSAGVLIIQGESFFKNVFSSRARALAFVQLFSTSSLWLSMLQRRSPEAPLHLATPLSSAGWLSPH